jgi:hypothetical protein
LERLEESEPPYLLAQEEVEGAVVLLRVRDSRMVEEVVERVGGDLQYSLSSFLKVYGLWEGEVVASFRSEVEVWVCVLLRSLG